MCEFFEHDIYSFLFLDVPAGPEILELVVVNINKFSFFFSTWRWLFCRLVPGSSPLAKILIEDS